MRSLSFKYLPNESKLAIVSKESSFINIMKMACNYPNVWTCLLHNWNYLRFRSSVTTPNILTKGQRHKMISRIVANWLEPPCCSKNSKSLLAESKNKKMFVPSVRLGLFIILAAVNKVILRTRTCKQGTLNILSIQFLLQQQQGWVYVKSWHRALMWYFKM